MTPADLKAALAAPKPGSILQIPPGRYGQQKFYNLKDVTLQLDPAAQFDTFALQNCSGVNVVGGRFELPPELAIGTGVKIVTFANCQGGSFTGATILGALATLGGPEDSQLTGNHLINGRPAGMGVSVEMKSTGIKLSGNDISRSFKGIVLSSTDHLTITGNNIHDFRTSGIVGDTTNSTISKNHIHSARPWAVGGDGDHSDLIHLFNAYKATAPSAGIAISQNWLDQDAGDPVPIGILIEGSPDQGFDGLVIDGNVILNSSAQGIAAFNSRNMRITNNQLLQISGNANDAPSIRLVGSKETVLLPPTVAVTGNTAHDVYGLLAYALKTAGMTNTIRPPLALVAARKAAQAMIAQVGAAA